MARHRMCSSKDVGTKLNLFIFLLYWLYLRNKSHSLKINYWGAHKFIIFKRLSDHDQLPEILPRGLRKAGHCPNKLSKKSKWN